MAEGKYFARLYEGLRSGKISRREFGQRAMAMGMSAAGVAFIVNSLDFKGAAAQDGDSGGSSMVGSRPTGGFENVTRGEGGELRALLWQAVTVLHPHNSTGTKDYLGASLLIEPLLNYTPDSTLTAALAAEVPTIENGGLAEDLSWVKYSLLPDVVWSDGEPFTANDVKFTFDWIARPENAAVTSNNYANVDNVEVVDDLTAIVHFKTPALGWFVPFSGTFGGSVLPGHYWDWDITNEDASLAFRSEPIGTGPFVVETFQENAQVTYVVNDLYREPNKPYFSRVNIVGGGDAPSAAIAVLQTGDFDWAWNLQVAPDVLQQLEAEGKGYIIASAGVNTESIYLNFADPNVEVEGERAHISTPHPSISDLAVRKAISFAIDRQTIADQFYGFGQGPAWNYLVGLPVFDSQNLPYSYDPDMANQLLDEAGWTLNGNVREKDGVQLSWVYHTSINTVRQQTQAVVRQNFQAIGIEVELRATDAGIFFDSAAGNDQNISHFYTDIQMYTTGPSSSIPLDYMVNFYAGPDNSNISQEENSWSRSNRSRYVNADYDAAYETALTTTDAELAAEKFIEMTDILTDDAVVVPLVARAASFGAATITLVEENIAFGPWEGDFWNIANWIRTAE